MPYSTPINCPVFGTYCGRATEVARHVETAGNIPAPSAVIEFSPFLLSESNRSYNQDIDHPKPYLI